VLAWGCTIRAGAGGRGGEGDRVHVTSGTEYEEGGAGTVEEAETVAEGTDYSVGDGLAGFEPRVVVVVMGMMVVVVVIMVRMRVVGIGGMGFHS